MIASRSPNSAEDILFLLFSIFGSLINLLLGAVFALASLSAIFSDAGESLPSPIWWAVAFGFLALCGIPGIWYGSKAFRHKNELAPSVPRISFLLAVPSFLCGLLLGYLAFSGNYFPHILSPLAKIISVSSVAFFIIQLVRKFSPAISQRRIWCQFTLGLWIVPIGALISELLLLIPTLFVFVLGALTTENGRFILDLLRESPSPSISELTEAANGILLEPWFIAILLGFFAVLVPIIEETLKTMPVWPWIIKRRDSREAFLGGIIGGAGYALFEALFLTQAESTWFPTLMGRAGATIIHAFATGLASWGLSEGFRRKRWGRMALSFLVAVIFHGLWNAGALSIALIEIKDTQIGPVGSLLFLTQSLIPMGIIGLTLIAFIAMIQIARRLGAPSHEADTVKVSSELN